MLPPVLFPDVELLLTERLRAALDQRPTGDSRVVHVSTMLPTPRPPWSVILRRDGGLRLDAVTDSPRVAVVVRAPSEQQAAELAELVRALIGAESGRPPIKAITFSSGASSVADVQPTRFFTVQLSTRATALT